MTKQELFQHLEVLTKKTNEECLSTFDKRKLKELEFHNRDRDRNLTENLPKDTYEKLHGNKKFYSTAELSRNYVENWLDRKTLQR